MFLRRISIFAISLIAAHGCAPIPRHDMASTMTSSRCDSLVAENAEDGQFAIGDWPKKEWWESFGDSYLNQIIAEALENSPTLKKAESRLKTASQVALQKRARLFPEIDFNADTNWQHLAKHGFFRQYAPTIPPVVNVIDLSFNFTYEFDFWGKYRDLFQAALGQAAAMSAEKSQAELILTTSIAYVYFEAQFLLKKIALLELVEKNKSRINDLTLQRQLHALAPAAEPLKSYSMALDTGAEVFAAEQELRMQLHKLKALSGLGQDNILELTYKPLTANTVALPSDLSLNLLIRRPDLKASSLRVEAAAKEINAAKTDFYPNFNLAAFVGLESVQWNLLFRKDAYAGSLEPAIHLPIFTAGRLKAQLYEKVAAFDEAVYTYNELILQAAQEVADNLSDISLLQKQIEVKAASLDSAQKRAELSRLRFQHAVDNEISVLDAKNVALDAELALIELEYGRRLAQVKLIRSLGGGYHFD